ncbi:hypothetical protein IMSAG049_01452 [Clostridiales bacterium]|nr:hypothetical protein IMSAG049_01452 [Clostridiales bacterium]
MILRSDMKYKARRSLQGHWGSSLAAAIMGLGAFPLISYAAEIFALKGPFLLLYFIIPAFMLISCLAIGNATMFLHLAQGHYADIVTYLSAFEDILSAILLSLIIFCNVFLWSLLFIVPGIAAAYNYRVAFYILAEEPDISPLRAAILSKKMLMGRKWDLFVLDFSLLGWFILTALTYGLAGLYVLPYCSAVYAVFYEELKAEYISKLEFENRRKRKTESSCPKYDYNIFKLQNYN